MTALTQIFVNSLIVMGLLIVGVPVVMIGFLFVFAIFEKFIGGRR